MTAPRKPKRPAKTADDAPIPEKTRNALGVFYTVALNVRAVGRRSVALAAVAEALEHIVEHDDDGDNAGVSALEGLAKLARRYTRNHRCYTELSRPPEQVEVIAAPTRAELLQALVGVVAESRTKRRVDLAKVLFSRLNHGAASMSLGVQPEGGAFDRIKAELHRTKQLGKDDEEDLVVAALVGWGMSRKQARADVKSAMKRSG